MAKKLKPNWEAYPISDNALDEMNFPLLCPRCLKRTDLTDYTVKIGNKRRNKKITMPICQSCKKTAVWKLRKEMFLIFAFWAPVSWGLLVGLGITGILGKIINALGFPWGLFLPVLLIGIPLYALYLLIDCFLPPIKGIWPITMKEQIWSLIFENETYVREFTKANTQKLRDVANYDVSPPEWLLKDGHLLL